MLFANRHGHGYGRHGMNGVTVQRKAHLNDHYHQERLDDRVICGRSKSIMDKFELYFRCQIKYILDFSCFLLHHQGIKPIGSYI